MVYLVLLLAVLSRVLPLLLHGAGGNVTTVGAALLFFGAGLKPMRRSQALIAVAVLAATDYWLTVYGYGYPFHAAMYLPTWLWYLTVCVCGALCLRTRRGPVRIVAAALATSTSFFLLSNGVVWLRSGMYPHTASGLGACYVAGLPFYRNDVLSTLVFSAVFFALPSAVAVLRGAVRPTGATAA